ncbi:MAG: hypothetical protein JWM11_1941 [Planctomycetaceae bacterium]|nr:hypothetical protein [Planctomycetaceae bacterium]
MASISKIVSTTDLSVPTRTPDIELTQRVDAKIFHQVRDLNVVRNENGIILRGHSQSFYVKQLATHAVLSLYPGMMVENAIAVGQ